MMNKKLKMLMMAIALLLGMGCIAAYKENFFLFSPHQSLGLSNQELEHLFYQANSGDTKAALRLYEFYSFVQYDEKQIIYCLSLAARQGNPDAQYNLAVLYEDSVEFQDLKKAKYWYRAAAMNGKQSARASLQRLAQQSVL